MGAGTADFADADITQSSLSTHNMKWSSDQEKNPENKRQESVHEEDRRLHHLRRSRMFAMWDIRQGKESPL